LTGISRKGCNKEYRAKAVEELGKAILFRVKTHSAEIEENDAYKIFVGLVLGQHANVLDRL